MSVSDDESTHSSNHLISEMMNIDIYAYQSIMSECANITLKDIKMIHHSELPR